VIAPASLIIYRGTLFEGWRGNAFTAGLASTAIVQIELGGDSVREIARYDMGKRIRSVVEGPDGALWVLEDGNDGRLLRLTPKTRD
jgi:glucose/arabinose dehydrogenase